MTTKKPKTLTFGELPKVVYKNGPSGEPKYQAEANSLKANSGKWAKFDTSHSKSKTVPYQLSSGIRNKKLAAFKDDNFEAKVINGELWVRHVEVTQ